MRVTESSRRDYDYCCAHPARHGNEFQYSGKNAQRYRVWKTQQKHRDRTIEEREAAKDYFCPDVALQHHVQFVRQRPHGCMVFFRRYEMNDLVGETLSVAQEKDCEDRDHHKSGHRRRRELFDFRGGALDIRAMPLEEGSDLVGLLIGPTEVISEIAGNFSRGDSICHGGNCREKLPSILAKMRKKTVRENRGEDDQGKIGFQDVRASQVFEKERVTLQKSHDRIDQICEQDRKGKNDDYSARRVNDGKYHREEKDCQQNTRCFAIRKNHESPKADGSIRLAL